MTDAFGLVGLNGIDFVLREGEPYVLEINPRYCGVHGADRAKRRDQRVRGPRGRLRRRCPRSTASPAARKCSARPILYARRDVVVGDSRRWLLRDDVRDVPFPGDRIARGHPVCTVFARGPDSVTCYARLVAAASALEQELEEETGGAGG